MLHSVTKPILKDASMEKNYISISDLARELGRDYDVIYRYILRENKKHPKLIKLYQFEAFGRKRFISALDAEHIRDVFLNFEDYKKEV